MIEVVLVDATERPIERPKKDSGGITMVNRSGTHKSTSDGKFSDGRNLGTDFATAVSIIFSFLRCVT